MQFVDGCLEANAHLININIIEMLLLKNEYGHQVIWNTRPHVIMIITINMNIISLDILLHLIVNNNNKIIQQNMHT